MALKNKIGLVLMLIFLAVFSLLSPVFINMIATYPIVQSENLKWLYPNPLEKVSGNPVWVPALGSIYGAILGGIISGILTLGGVLLSNQHQANERVIEKNDRLRKILVYFHYEVKDNKAILDRAFRFIGDGEDDIPFPKWDLKKEAFEKYFLELIDLVNTDELHFIKETYDLINNFEQWSGSTTKRIFVKEKTGNLINKLDSLSQKLKNKEAQFKIELI
ncbi:hypothetical protein ACNRWW_02395 [Metabacillus sp. HB246100]